MAKDFIDDFRAVAPARLVIAGDWHKHSHALHAIHVMKYANLIGADGIIHVGDLGYNFDAKDGRLFDKPLRSALEKYNLFLIWIDGNHENHDWLQSLAPREDGFVKTGEGGRLFWAPRGHSWEWGDTTFGALGGAYSINEKFLDEGKSLFAELEQVKADDVTKLGLQKLDVLLTHDVPEGVRVKKGFNLKKDVEAKAEISRKLIREAIENTKPEHVFSGHWHQRRDEELIRSSDGGRTEVHVLDMEYTTGNILVYDVFLKEVTKPENNWKEQIKFNTDR